MTEKLAAGWAAFYGTVALVWTVTGNGFPYGPDAGMSPLRALAPSAGAPVFAVVLLLTAVFMLILSGGRLPTPPVRVFLLAYVGSVAAVLLVVVPDTRLLALLGYTPILLVGLPFGWPGVDWSTVFTWTLANQAFALLGGVLLARAALRRHSWTISVMWGRRATYVAAAIPVLYALTRFAWALGVPLGLPSSTVNDLHDTGAVWAGVGLATFAVAGAVLTLGLVQRWGEVFPRWMPVLAGRRVPIRLANVPATLVAILVMSASAGFFADPIFWDKLTTDTMAVAPMLTWPLWSLTLAAATLAYHLRRSVSPASIPATAPLVGAR